MPTPRTRHLRSSSRRRAGFSLVELMVALGVGGLAITSMYAIAASSTRTFQQQMQLASTQSALRTGMELVKRDIARAGYLATPLGTLPGEACVTPSSPLHVAGSGNLAAISRFTNDVLNGTTNPVDPDTITGGDNTANGFTADEVVLLGNYETPHEYPGISVVSAGTVAISSDWHAFREDFTGWFNDPATGYERTLFEDVFRVGRPIRIRTVTGRNHFAQITAVIDPGATTNLVQVSFAPFLPPACEAEATGGTIAPLNFIRYFPRLTTSADPGFPRMEPARPMAQLVRREVDPNGKINALVDPIGNTVVSERSVLDYLVAFNLAFVMNRQNFGVGIVDNFTIGGDPAVAGSDSTETPLVVNSNPERVRAVRIELAARAPLEDPTFPWDATTCGNLRCYRVRTDSPRAARVRVLRTEVFLPNVALGGF